MSTLDEIETAVDKLPLPQQEQLLFLLAARLGNGGTVWRPTLPHAGHSVLDIAPASAGEALRPLTADDDLLDEMLEGHA